MEIFKLQTSSKSANRNHEPGLGHSFGDVCVSYFGFYLLRTSLKESHAKQTCGFPRFYFDMAFFNENALKNSPSIITFIWTTRSLCYLLPVHSRFHSYRGLDVYLLLQGFRQINHSSNTHRTVLPLQRVSFHK